MIVRPDGYLAFRARSEYAEELESYLRRFFDMSNR